MTAAQMTAGSDVSLDVGGYTFALRRCNCGGDDVCLGWAPLLQALRPAAAVALLMRHGATELCLRFTWTPPLQLVADDSMMYTRGNLVLMLQPTRRNFVHASLSWGDGDDMELDSLVEALAADGEEEGGGGFPVVAIRDWFCGV